MRETCLEKAGADRITVRTDDRGTLVLDPSGQVLEEHGNDRHEAALARYRESGWRVASDAAVRPEAAGAQQPASIAGDAGGRGPAATASDGEDA